MLQGKLRTRVGYLLGLYTLLTFFFLFVGFNRSSALSEAGLRYQLIFEGIPLNFPSTSPFSIWFFNLGNFLAFIPFGLVIPLLVRCRFVPFILLFIFGITGVELLQMGSGLGAFDVNDIVINTLGASVGYASQRLVVHNRTARSGLLKILYSAIILTAITYVSVSGMNYYLNHGSGEVIALDQHMMERGGVVWEQQPTGFTVGRERIDPLINRYSGDNPRQHEFTVRLDGQFKEISGYMAIPDELMEGIGGANSEVILSADGEVIYSLQISASQEDNHLLSFQSPLHGKELLTVSIHNDTPAPDTHVVLWDVTLTEANAGQKLLQRIKSLFGQ